MTGTLAMWHAWQRQGAQTAAHACQAALHSQMSLLMLSGRLWTATCAGWRSPWLTPPWEQLNTVWRQGVEESMEQQQHWQALWSQSQQQAHHMAQQQRDSLNRLLVEQLIAPWQSAASPVAELLRTTVNSWTLVESPATRSLAGQTEPAVRRRLVSAQIGTVAPLDAPATDRVRTGT